MKTNIIVHIFSFMICVTYLFMGIYPAFYPKEGIEFGKNFDWTISFAFVCVVLTYLGFYIKPYFSEIITIITRGRVTFEKDKTPNEKKD